MSHIGTFLPFKSRDNCRLLERLPAQYDRGMSKSFRDALLEALEANNVSLQKVAAETGVSYEQLKKLKQGKSRSTNVDDALRVANFFGMSLDEFLQDESAKLRSEIVDLFDRLSASERDYLLKSARGLVGDQDPSPDQSR